MDCGGWHHITPCELEDGGQFHPSKILQDVEYRFFVCGTAGNICIAFFAREHHQAEGFYFLPERLVFHRLKPGHNIIYVFEFHIERSLPDQFLWMQILFATQGKPSCRA